ncbi:MAG: DUF4194 domain-containing protein [Chromatiaceae bacterium]
MAEAASEYEGGATANLSALVIPLLKGVIYQENDPALWNGLLNLQARVRDYVSVIGLDLMLDEAEGYAFLRSRHEEDEETGVRLPRLIARRPLSFPVSLLLALLRKRLAEADAGGGDTRLVLTREDMVELIRVFLPANTNEARLIDQIDAHVNKVVELGFLRTSSRRAQAPVRRPRSSRSAASSRPSWTPSGWQTSTNGWPPTRPSSPMTGKPRHSRKPEFEPRRARRFLDEAMSRSQSVCSRRWPPPRNLAFVLIFGFLVPFVVNGSSTR